MLWSCFPRTWNLQTKKMHSELAVRQFETPRWHRFTSLHLWLAKEFGLGKVSFIEVVMYPVTFIEVALSHDCISAKGRFWPPRDADVLLFLINRGLLGFLLGCITHITTFRDGYCRLCWGWLGFFLDLLLASDSRHNFLSHDWQTQGWLKVVSWLLSRCRDRGIWKMR